MDSSATARAVGMCCQSRTSPGRGGRKRVFTRLVLSPLPGLPLAFTRPTARVAGYPLAPLRGLDDADNTVLNAGLLSHRPW